MAKAGIRAIIFDIGRVLVRVDVQRAQKGLANGLPLTPQELWSAIEKDPRWKDWQEGRLSAPDWYLNLSKRFGMSLSFEEFTTVWNSPLDPQPIHPDHLFSELSKSYRLGLLSNTDPIHVAHLEATYNFFHYFPKEVRTYSCAVGASKPEPLIFREALRACKVSAEQAVYIDDIPAYADAARALGFHGVHYRSPEQLQSDFETLGIKTDRLLTT
ncbi:MAG TPA: HAD family phosphatase [Candidatus Sulfotelmatobacter sp.]|nr:HAD family phosphatase [Candidatus Sulfotelmatobacter sp.]